MLTLLDWREHVRINNIASKFNKVISGVPQGSIVGPIPFNSFFINGFIKNAKVYNLANDIISSRGSMITPKESDSGRKYINVEIRN